MSRVSMCITGLHSVISYNFYDNKNKFELREHNLMKLTRSKFNEMIPDEIDALYEEQFIAISNTS